MLRITQSNSAEGAIKYFDEGLSKSDYYAKDDKTIGKWGGKAAKELGLEGEVTREDFAKLAYNINPLDDQQLTPRNNSERRVGYDFTFSVPKSVSIVHSITGDKEIEGAFNTAVQATMLQIEKDTETRVRINGAFENRNTGNMVWGSFTHSESRPVGGIPDPHLHQHVFVFNTTYDKVEKRWKAADIGEIKATAPYFQAMFHSNLASELQKVGYQVERNARDFEFKGFERSLIEKYSRRTIEIEKVAKELGVTYDKDRAELGAKTRASKRVGFSMQELRMQWKSRLAEKEIGLVFGAKGSGDSTEGNAKQTATFLERAISHNLERKSVATKKEILQEALVTGIGQTNFEKLHKYFEKAGLTKGHDIFGREVFTSKEALEEERKLKDTVRSGRGQFEQLHWNYTPRNEKLTAEQKGAVSHVLTSRDMVTIIAGRAGTGKTWSIKEIKAATNAVGVPFKAFAPSSTASREVQREEGFEGATTIAELVKSKKHQRGVEGGLIWLDEAGLVGNKTMNQVLEIAKEQKARVLLSGDIRQHSSVERGNALQIIQSFGGIKPHYLTNIKRQQQSDYKQAVSAISNGEVLKGIDSLDKMGAIKEHGSSIDTVNAAAKDYVDSTKGNNNVLLVATTHAQGKNATDMIRNSLKEAGKLSEDEKSFTVQQDLSFTEAQKQEVLNYAPGMAVQFHQNVKGGFKRGAKYDVVGVKDNAVLLKSEGSPGIASPQVALPIASAQAFSVYRKEQIDVAVGDKLRITQNGFSANKKRLNNGNILTVTGFDQEGNIMGIRGKTKVTLDKGYRNLTHGYYTTSPASQGKTANKVIILQDSSSGRAASKEQFYVSASRGKFEIAIHTDDKTALRRSAQRSSLRITATGAVNKRKESRAHMKLWKLSKAYAGKAAQMPAIQRMMRTRQQGPPSKGR